MKKSMFILGLSLMTMAASASNVQGYFLRIIQRPGGGITILCGKAPVNCFSVVVKADAGNEPGGSWRVSAYDGEDQNSVVASFDAKANYVMNPDGDDPVDCNSYFFETLP